MTRVNRACRHENQRYIAATVFVPSNEPPDPLGYTGQGWVDLVGQRRCDRCRQVVPLGPANTASEAVRVEIAAVKIVNARAAQQGHKITSGERFGWALHECADPPRPPCHDDEHAGWLARCIWTHCDDHPEGTL